MASSLREYILARDVGGIVWFWTIGGTVLTSLSPSEPTPLAEFEELRFSQPPDFFRLTDSDGRPWFMRISAVGTIEVFEADIGGMSTPGYGPPGGLTLRGATRNTFTYAVSPFGLLSIVETAAPTGILDPDYVDGTFRINYCREHGLPYRPDERIYPLSSTHCPRGRHPGTG